SELENARANSSQADTSMPQREGRSGERGSPIRCGILALIFGEASSCPSNEEIFRRPFNMRREFCCLRSTLDAERANLEAACDNAEGILLSKCDLDKALASDRERISALLFKIDALRAERDEAIWKVAGAEDRALQSLTGSPTLASRAMPPLAHDLGEGLSFGEKALIVREPMADLNQEGPGLSEVSEPSQTEAAHLRAGLEPLRVECSQEESVRGSGSLPMGLARSSSALIIAEYLRSDAYRR
ncbi:hypothetical protein ACLOJK_019708, partial [Asimina triloba]